MNVLSLFDGISCGQIALERARIKVDKYYASEICEYSINITKKNYPSTIEIGDVREVTKEKIDSKIDLLIGGSPCQNFSFAGKMNGVSTKNMGMKFKAANVGCMVDYMGYTPRTLEEIKNAKGWD